MSKEDKNQLNHCYSNFQDPPSLNPCQITRIGTNCNPLHGHKYLIMMLKQKFKMLNVTKTDINNESGTSGKC